MRLAFDIETNGLLREGKDGRPKATKVHCLVTQDVDSGEVRRYWDPRPRFVSPDGDLADGIAALKAASCRISHNGVGFDYPIIKRFFHVDLWDPATDLDTLVLARREFPRIGDQDRAWERRHKAKFPRELFGRHSLAAWGHRIGHEKGSFGQEEHAFDELSAEMVEYCVNDVAVTVDLFRRLMAKNPTEGSLRVEHRFAWQIARMMDNGFPFDLAAAEDLLVRVETEMAEVDERLHAALGRRWVPWKGKTQPRDPSHYEQRDGQWGQEEPVNLGSTIQVADKLVALYGWKPEKYTADGRAQFDDAVVSSLPDTIPVKADLLRRASLTAARRRLVGDEKKGTGLIPAAEPTSDGHRIFHFCNHNGTRTGRCSHAHPNPNFPRVTSQWGPEFRGMVRAPEGWVMVGADMSGIDARMIAHYLAPLDGGAMIDLVLSGDLHDHNREIMAEVAPGIDRSTGKNVFYAVCYGGRARRVGITAGGVGPKLGGRLRARILERVRGLPELIAGISSTAEQRGWLRGLDGRRLYPDAPFSALNTLSQGGAALTMKEATALAMERLEAERVPAYLVIHMHDEGQVLTLPEYADTVGRVWVESMREAGRAWGVRCPLDGEYKVGASWAETH